MQVSHVQGSMPPFHNLVKFTSRSQLSTRSLASPSPNSFVRTYASAAEARLLAVDSSSDTLYAPPSSSLLRQKQPACSLVLDAETRVSSHSFFLSSTLLRETFASSRSSASSRATRCRSFPVVRSLGGQGGRDPQRRRGSDSRIDPSPWQSLQHSFTFHFFNMAGGAGRSELSARALHDSAGPVGVAEAQPGGVTYTRPEEEGGAATSLESSTWAHAVEGALRLESGVCALPHPEKVQRGGEDAHFIASADLSAVGVADGVGGWADVGVDAGLYARELMRQSVKALMDELQAPSTASGSQSEAKSGAAGPADLSAEVPKHTSSLNANRAAAGLPSLFLTDLPKRVLVRAHAATRCQGSATACILVLADNKLVAANLGDSGFVVIRNGKTIFKSPPQQHDFNFPYQLGSEGSDSPQMAQVFSLPVAAGDVLVVGTDGLFDNLFDSDVTAVVMHCVKAGKGPQATSEQLAALARLRAQDRTHFSPFAKAAQEAGYRYQGGKMDDITVLVSYITSRQLPPRQQPQQPISKL
eukprot:TRINITY_DN16597_c0_g1_i1.p1 TRINITY_DN16597_c0_g1~~TRINITY_DN16597_c0_g1_i1.p1  ORF type:complete len:528 (+),score=72.50 TRINITY_DN16597_c0_g1_i1:164-1747(+)